MASCMYRIMNTMYPSPASTTAMIVVCALYDLAAEPVMVRTVREPHPRMEVAFGTQAWNNGIPCLEGSLKSG